MWTGIDYLGESFGRITGASSGCIDSCGFPKDGYYFYQSQWTEKPMLHLFPHWNWKGREGQFLTVLCYTNCDSVELFLNGKSVGVKGYAFPRYGMQGRYGQHAPAANGRRAHHNDLHLAWDVPYEPGTLKAVGMKGGKVAAEVEISTTGDPAAHAAFGGPRHHPRRPARRGACDREGAGCQGPGASGCRQRNRV